MEQEIKHTPLPWEWLKGMLVNRVGEASYRKVITAEHEYETGTTLETSDADAEFIVRAVNNHYKLLDLVWEYSELLQVAVLDESDEVEQDKKRDKYRKVRELLFRVTKAEASNG